MNILIAEDDVTSRKLLVCILEELGHTVTVTSDGEEAWESYSSMPSRLMIVDWLMPRMDGLELVRKVRAHEQASDQGDYTYIVMLTANSGQQQNHVDAMDAGVDDFLAKPLDHSELEMRLKVAQRILKAASRIRSLETILTVCTYTKKVNLPDEGWQTIEEFMRRHLGIAVSHGIEPDYYDKHIVPQLEAMKRSTQR